MSLGHFKCTDFRCLENPRSSSFDPGNNLILRRERRRQDQHPGGHRLSGPGALIPRRGQTRELVRHGAGRVRHFWQDTKREPREISLGVRNSKSGLEVHTDGEKSASAAPLAEALPLQVIDPDVHDLVAGGPEGRRSYLDWMTFHVEHGYLEQWRRFRRALKQRNAALREGSGPQALIRLGCWSSQSLAKRWTGRGSGRSKSSRLQSRNWGRRFSTAPSALEYQRGWAAGKDPRGGPGRGSVERDLQLGQHTGRAAAGGYAAQLRRAPGQQSSCPAASRSCWRVL